MSNQLQITGGAKVRALEGVITGTTGVLSSVPYGGANGVATLDSAGKIPVSQLPNSVMEYKGTWNVTTNTPYLVNGVGNAGDVYMVVGAAVGGTNHDFGAGNILFYNGDQAIYDGSQYQRASGSSGTVTSVAASITGNSLGITGSPITTAGTLAFAFAGTSGQYVNGAGNLTTFPSLTGFVPYTGATNDLNLGTHNLYANNIFDGFINVAASGSQIVLTIASAPSYTITGSGGQTIKLPDATTLPNGAIFSFNNNQSSGAITINNNSNTLVVSVPSGGFAEVVLLDNSIAAGSWDRHFKAPSNVSWSTNTLDYAGSITSATWNGNVVAINRGGTGSSTQNFVDLTTTQTIAGAKTFSGNLTANSFIKIGGGNLEFLKADGSVDSTAYVQYVTATSPLVRTGATNTPILSIPAATSSVNGYLTSTDWTTFNSKATVSGVSGRVAFYNGPNSLTSDSYLNFDSSTKRLSIGDFSTVVPPAALSMISTIGAWYNRNVASTVNYNGIGLYYDGIGYGHLFQTERVGASSDYSRISFINNNTSFVLDEDYNVGINTRIPTPGTSGPGGVGLDIWGGSQTAALALHNTASGSTTSDGGRLYLVNAGNLLLRNLETGSVIVSADNGDVVLQAGGFEKLRAISGGNVSITGSLQQSAVTSAILKTSSTGVIVAAVAGTDYLAVGSAVTSVTATSPVVSSGGTTPAISMAAATTSVSGYLTSTDWNTFNSKFTLPSLTAGSVLFSNGTTIAQDNAAFFWDDTNNRLGLGTNAPGSLLTLFGAGDNTYFNIQYTGGSIASIEAVGTSVSGHGVLNLGRAGTTNVVINGYGDSYFTGGNLGVGINSPTYRLHVSGTLGVTGAATFSSSITASSLVKSGGTSSQFLKADGTVDSSVYLTTSSAASSYVPLGRTLTINGLGYNLYNDQSWSVGTVTGSSSGSTSTRVAFWNSAINLTSSANLYWDNTNSRLGINKGVPTTALDVVGQGTFYQGTATLNTVAVALSGQADQSFSGTETNQYALIGMSGVYYSYAASDFTPNASSGHCGSASTIFKENTGSFLGHLSGYTASFNIAGTGSVTTLSGYRINTPKQWSVGAGHTLFSGTITTLAGVYIDNLRGDSTINSHTTNSWGIYQSGASDNNYFAGKVLIGTNTVGTYALDVTGTGRFTGALTGTSATFSSGLIVSNTADVYPEFKTSAADADAFLGFSNTGDGNNAWSIGRRNTGEFWISNYTGNFNSGTRTQPLTIASTGAATFSSGIGVSNANATTGGIQFPATQVAISDPNNLDDYEEGTWTAVVIGSTSAGTASYSSQNGLYVKIGRLVTFSTYCDWNSGTGTGTLQIGGLPFTADSTAVYPACSIGEVNNITLTSNNVMTARVQISSTKIFIQQYPTGGGAATSVSYDSSGYIVLSGSYYI